MQSVTVGVSDLPAALHLFHDVMGLAIEHRAPLSPSRAKLWGLPAGTGGEMVELSCRGYPIGRMRVVALNPAPRAAVRLDPLVGGTDTPLDVGPKAIDFYVRSPVEDSWRELVAAGCTARSKPVRHVIDGNEQEECVLFGPDGVPLLIMVGHNHPPSQMRPGTPHGKYSEVPTISVVAGDLQYTRAFYEGALGLVAGTDAETAPEFRDQVNDLVGIPRGTRVHFLTYQSDDEPSGKILLVYFGGQSKRRLTGRMHPSRLGVGLFTHATRDLKALRQRLSDVGASIEVAATDVDGVPTMLVRGPNEELFEFVEQR